MERCRAVRGTGRPAALTGVLVRGAEPPPLSQQLSDLGRQALARGEMAQAHTFFRKALELDANNAEARQGLSRAVPPQVRRVALQDPGAPPAAEPPRAAEPPPAAAAPEPAPDAVPPPPPTPAEPEARATLENLGQIQSIARQQSRRGHSPATSGRV